MRLLLTVLGLCMFCSVFAQDKTITYYYDEASQPVELVIQYSHIQADVRVDPYKQLVYGTANYTFKTLRKETDSIMFKVLDMKFSSINISGDSVNYKYSGDDIIIYPIKKLAWQKEYVINFSYTANPGERMGWGRFNFIGWDDTTNVKRKQIWVISPLGWMPYSVFQGTGYERITSDLNITFDKNYKVFSNGVRVSVKENKDNTKTWHYRMTKPYPFFLVTLVIGDYKYKSLQTKRGLPMELWYYPDEEDHFETTYKYTQYMFEFLEKEFGVNYPWELYREVPVIDYTVAGMETTTATVWGDFMQVDPRGFWSRNFINVNVHELIHQWFGDYVSCYTWKQMFVAESFATYYSKIFEKDVFGDDKYQYERDKELKRTLDASAKDNYPIGHIKGDVPRWYPKGSLVLDMLRYVLGDEEFKISVTNFLKKYPYKAAYIDDFVRVIHETTGRPMDWFFDEWIHKGGEPNYEVSYKSLTDKTGTGTYIKVSQIHQVNELIGYFKMPVVFEVHYKDGTFDSKKEWIENQYSEVIIPNKDKKEIDYVLFDPNRQIIKKVTFKKSFEELSAQALRAKNMIDRYDALVALKDFAVDKKRDLLTQCYKKETFYFIKNEILIQLAEDALSMDLIRQAINDKNAYVRRTVLTYVKNVPQELKADYEKLLKDSCYINVEFALTNLVKSFPENTEKYLDITKGEEGWNGKNIRIKWLQIAIDNGKKENLKELVSYSSISYDFETRIRAFNTLNSLNYLDKTVIGNLVNGCLHWHSGISNTAKDVLTYFYKQNVYKKMINEYYKSKTWSDNEKTILKKIITEV